MHAFDADKLAGNIRVRRAAVGESLQLLNEQTVVCEHHELLISDDKGAVALAGVMGGLGSAVHSGSTRVFFESACFAPTAVRSEEHTSELQSLMRISYAVFCLKTKNTSNYGEQIRHALTNHYI